MDDMDTRIKNEDFERLLKSAKEGSHRISKFPSKEEKDEEHTLKHISTIIDSLPVLGLLSEIGFKEETTQVEFQKEEQEVMIYKEIDNISEHFELQDNVLAEICPSYFTAEYLGKYLMNIITLSSNSKQIQMQGVYGVIKVAKNLMNHNKLDKGILSKHILSNVDVIPLYAITEMIESGIISVQQWVCELYNKNVLSHLKNQVLDHLKQVGLQTNSDDSTKLMHLILCIANTLDCSELRPELKTQLKIVIYCIFEETDFSKLFSGKLCPDEPFFVLKLTDVNDCYHKERTKLASILLENLLINGEKYGLDEAFERHFEWLYQKLPNNTVSVLQELLLYQENDSILKIIRIALRNHILNCQRLLTVLSVWLICCEEAHKKILELLHARFDDAFELQSQETFKVCLLITRHCSLENLSGFPSYSNWFSEHITHLTSIFSKERGHLSFYINTLTSLLPVEAKSFLRVQILNLSKVQNFGKTLVHEYINAAKTRMNYLKDAMLDVDKFKSSSTQFNEFALKDVEKALSQYSKTSEIPNNLLELSVFRKSYFIGAFLPALMMPDLVKNDMNRKRFIDDLQKAGKIPSKILEAYQQAFEAHELEEIFSNTDANLGDLVEVVTRKISELPNVLQERKNYKDLKKQRMCTQSYMSSLSTHLTKLYQAFVMECPVSSDKGQFEEKIVDAILDSICFSCASEFGEDNATGDNKWLRTLISILKEYDTLQVLLERKIIGFLRTELENLTSYHLHAFACIVSLCNDACRSGSKGKENTEELCLLKRVMECMKEADTPIWLHRSLHFLSDVLLISSEMFSDVIIADDDMIGVINTSSDLVIISDRTIRYWIILYTRSKTILEILKQSEINKEGIFMKEISDAVDFSESVRNIKVYKSFVNNNSIQLEEWLEFEMAVPSDSDTLPSYQKKDYYYRVISTFQSSANSVAWQYKNIAVKIVHLLLSFQSSLEYLKCDEHGSGSYRGIKARENGINDILNLLQSLNYKISFDAGDNDNHNNDNWKWFISALVAWVKNTKETNQNNSSDYSTVNVNMFQPQLSALCCIIRALPSFALFSSSGTTKITHQCVDNVIRLVNDVSSLISKDLALPCNFLECLLDAIESYCGLCVTVHGCSEDELNYNMSRLYSLCPTIFISTAFHLSKPQIQAKLGRAFSSRLCCFNEVIALLEHIRKKEFTILDNFVNPHSFRQFPKNVIGVCIYNCYEEEFIKSTDCFSMLTVLKYDYLQVVYDCVMIRLCKLLIRNPEKNDRTKGLIAFALQFFNRLQDIVIDISGDVLSHQSQLGLMDLREIFSTKFTLQMYPVVFLKVLLQMDPLRLQNFASLMKNKAILSKCLCCVDALVKNAKSCWPEGLLIEPLSISFATDLERLARKLHITK